MAAEPSRHLVPSLPRVGFLRTWHLEVDGLLRTGQLERTAALAALSAALAEELGDPVTAINVRLLRALAMLGAGRPTVAETETRNALVLIERLAPPDPTLSAVISAGGGSLPPDALPAHVRFWRAEALALLARAVVTQGRVATAMDLLADAMAGIEDTEPLTVDDAAACLIVANGLSAVGLLEASSALAVRALAVTDRLTVQRPHDDLVMGIHTTLARRLAEATALLAAYASLSPGGESTVGRFVTAMSTALRHRRAAEASRATRELDVARIFLAFSEQPLRGRTPDGLLELSEEGAVQDVLTRLDNTVVVGPGRGGGPLGRMVLARLRAQRGDVPGARAVLAAGEVAHPQAEQGISPWFGLVGIAQAMVEGQADDPAVALWRELTLGVVTRQWRERDARFDDLRHRITQRQLRWRRAATEGELLRDPLTGLGNRRRLEVELDREISSVLFVDMDRFKQINDRCGHEVGDVVLRRVGNILRACCRTPDVVVRYGGDEFVVVLDRGSDARALGERVIERVRAEDWSALTGDIPVTVSIGAAAAPTLRDALRQSDSAMLAAKQAGRDGLILRGTDARAVSGPAVPTSTPVPWPGPGGTVVPLRSDPDGEPGADPDEAEGAVPAPDGADGADGAGGADGGDQEELSQPRWIAAGALRGLTGGTSSSGVLVRPDDAGGLMPLLRFAATQVSEGDWDGAERALQVLTVLARQFGDAATARDARLFGLVGMEGRSTSPQRLEAAREFLREEEGPTAARAAGLGALASALLEEDRVAEALTAVAEGYELVVQGTGWSTHRAVACLTLSAPLCSALLFDHALELLALGERLVRSMPVQPWALISPYLFAWQRARVETLCGWLVRISGDQAGADRRFGAGASHALRALAEVEARSARPGQAGSIRDLRVRAVLAAALTQLGVRPADPGDLVRHIEREPFIRVSLLSRLTLVSVQADTGDDVATALAGAEAVRTAAEPLGEPVLGHVATALAARLAQQPGPGGPAIARWRRAAERQLTRFRSDRVSRFEALLSARQTEALSAAVETERSRLWEDPLTAVGNRRLLDRLLADPVMAARPTAFIDVDWFKQINDEFGHAVGDEVLRQVAGQLVAASRAGDVVVRYGGDEFVVVLDEGSNIDAYCERVRRGVSGHPWRALRPGLEVTVTVGGVAGGPRSMSRADAALLAAKNARKAHSYRSSRSQKPASSVTR